jgi:protein-tyrosine-phosphatase
MTKPIRILTICTGNINRSASAHVILEHHNTEGKYEVKSCGTGKVAPLSRKIPRKMRLALEELGYNPNNHRSQGITEELLTWADKIVVMGNAHWKFLEQHYPEHLTKATNWLVKDPHFATGNELHRAVAKEIQQLVQLNFCNRGNGL